MNDEDRQTAISAGHQLALSGISAAAEILREVPDVELAEYVANTQEAMEEARTPASLIARAHQHYRYVCEQQRRAES